MCINSVVFKLENLHKRVINCYGSKKDNYTANLNFTVFQQRFTVNVTRTFFSFKTGLSGYQDLLGACMTQLVR